VTLGPAARELRRNFPDCFGCGPANPIGLHLDGFVREGNTVTAEFQPRPEYGGFHGVLHGGIVTTALDEILAWTAILVAGSPAVTATMELKFRNPAPTDGRYRLEGTLVEQRGRRLLLTATCHHHATLVAEAKALFLAR
jgi:acyl-coenzyme A thioesterase PaaI-like protein